jgi:hypothetical protein
VIPPALARPESAYSPTLTAPTFTAQLAAADKKSPDVQSGLFVLVISVPYS